MSARLTTAEIGRCAENAVCAHLAAHAYEILQRNYIVHRIGELDVIARKGNRLLFVEVKGRVSLSFEAAFASLTAAKQLRLRRSAMHYLQKQAAFLSDMNNEIIFLAAAVLLDDQGTVRKIRLEPLYFA